MSDQGTSTEHSGAPAGSDPAAPSGSGGGTPAGFVAQADHDRIEQQRRSFQAEADRLKAENDRLQAALQAPKPDPAPAPAPTGNVLDEAAIARLIGTGINAALNQRDALTSARDRLSQEYPSARQDVLSASYSTPEEMAAAVKASHESEAAYAAEVRKNVEADVFASMKERYGIDVTPQVPPAEGAQGEKKITAADIAQMSMAEVMALDPKVREAALTGG